jgi:hypothetical protein
MKSLMKAVFCLVSAFGLVLSAAAQDVVNTVVGGGPNNIPGVNANQYNPYEVAVDAAGNVYVASSPLNRVFKISTTGIVSVVAGNGFAGYRGDAGPAVTAELNSPYGVAVDTASPANVYISDTNNCLVRKVDQATGVITTIAGDVTGPTSTSCGYSGNGGKANAAELYYPYGLAINPSTNDIYFAEFNAGVVRKVAGGLATGTISVVAGGGGSATAGNNCGGSAPYGLGGAATSAYLCYPQTVALDTTANPVNVFISESNSGGHCDILEVVGSSKDIYEVAGSYALGCGFTDNVNALKAQLNDPWQIHVSVSGTTTTVQVADYSNARVRQFPLTYKSAVPTPGTITTIAGKGEGGWCNDDGQPALNACMNPVGIAYDASGNYYIGDYGSDRVRKVAKSNTYISTIDGWGPNGGTQPNYSDPVGLTGVGGTASLYYPTGVWADPTTNNVYVGGYDGEAVYLWNSATNEITGFAGNGVGGFAGDGSAASSTATELNQPIGTAKDSSGNIYIADYDNCAIRQVNTSGVIKTIAGGTSGALKGCGYTDSSAVDSQFNGPNGVAIDSANNIYISDYSNCAIRKITAATDEVSTLAGGPTVGCGYSGDQGPAVKAQLNEPQEIALDSAGNIYFADQGNLRIREIVATTGNIQTVAGDGAGGYTGDGPATERTIYYPGGVTVDPNGNIFVSDTDNQILRWVTPTGQMLTFAGTVPGGPISSSGFSGDGGPALKAQFYQPAQISRDGAGNTYVADEYNHRVRQVTPFAGYGLSSANLSFETQPAGTVSDFQALTISAVGPTTISSISVSANFSEIDDCVGASLTANQTCEVDVYFQPAAAGKINGTLTIASNAFFANNPNTVALSGTGAGLKLSGSLAFGSEPLKTPVTSTLTLTNSGTAVSLSKIYLTTATVFTISGGTCSTTGGSLAAGGSCTIIVSFTPTVVGAQKSTLVIASSDPASPLLTGATGTGTEVKTSASSISFGSISYGTTLTSNLTITNTGTTAFTLSPAIAGAGFLISSTGKTCSTSIAAGASCVLPVEYDPTAVGSNTGTLTLTTNGGSSPVIPLTGTATTDVSVSPTSLAFGTIAHATTKVLDVTVTNVGKIASMTVSGAISGTGAADFVVLSTGNTCTTGVAPGKSCTLPVEFKPAAAASYAATLTITTNGGSNPTVALTGTGN